MVHFFKPKHRAELAMRILDQVQFLRQLLLIISFQQRFQGKYYLWGVFKAKRDSSGNTTMPNGSKPAT
ncbi:hypothetical protein H5410_022481 [Solanum commersonii]|uniref:Uncharacterized protein n=1 Tax=Solanum commersonii TaxID=4109 RepID=A0A9J5ZHA6_SOLCO|nr:hypothetical protein H5410_022481 [Solanum commersonii]